MAAIPEATPELVAQMAPVGVLRVGINLGNPVIAQRDPAGGEPRGVGAALGREVARRLRLGVRFTTYETAGKLADAMKALEVDVGFLAIDPARAVDIDFTDAYVLIEGTCVVRDDSPCRALADLDQPGRRIAVGLKTAYDLYLTREIRAAELVREPSSIAALERFVADRLDAAAGVRQPLDAFAASHPGHRVLEESFMVIRQASGVPVGRKLAHGFLAAFIEEAKANGFVRGALAESGVGEVSVAPALQR